MAVISLVSLLGIAMVPFLRKGTRLGHYYKYIYALLIALGASSLFCDAILHLIPHVSPTYMSVLVCLCVCVCAEHYYELDHYRVPTSYQPGREQHVDEQEYDYIDHV